MFQTASVPPAASAAPQVQSTGILADELANLPHHLLVFAKTKGPDVAMALALLLVAWMLSKWVRRTVIRGFARAEIDITLGKFFGNLAKWTIVIFAMVTCAGTLGVPTATFATVIGAAGLAIGLALQGNLSNLASGVLLLIFRPFKVGDAVIVAGQTGIIDGIDLFTTNLDTGDNRRIVVPNGAIFGGVIENQTYHDRRVVTINVPVSGAISLEFSGKVLREAISRVAASTPGALADPAPAVVLAEIFPTVVWTVSVHAQTQAFAAIRQALLRELKLSIDEHALAVLPPTQFVKQIT